MQRRSNSKATLKSARFEHKIDQNTKTHVPGSWKEYAPLGRAMSGVGVELHLRHVCLQTKVGLMDSYDVVQGWLVLNSASDTARYWKSLGAWKTIFQPSSRKAGALHFNKTACQARKCTCRVARNGTGAHAVCLAYRKRVWSMLASGSVDVGEDGGQSKRQIWSCTCR